MKRIVVFLSLAACFNLKAQVSVSLEQPELKVLYRDYDNYIIPVATGAEENELLVNGGIALMTQYKGKKAYKIKPDLNVKEIAITHKAKIKGVWKTIDTTNYKVKPFPTPIVYNYTISKTSGANIRCGFPLETLIKRTFQVISVSIMDQEINGSIVPSDLVKHLKPGNNIELTVKIRDFESGSESIIMTSLKVIN